MSTSPLIDLDPELVAPDVSTRLVRAFLAHVAEEHGEAAAQALVEGSGLPRAWLDDPENRVSTSYIDGLTRTWARQRHGLPDLPPHDHEVYQAWRLIGRRVLTRQALGAGLSVVRAVGSPAAFYARMPDLAARVNRRLALSTESPGAGLVRIRCATAPSAPPGYQVPAYSCWNLLGVLESVPTLWGLPLARVELLTCQHRDPRQDHCLYEVRFAERSISHPVSLALGALGMAAAGFSLGGVLAGPTAAGLGAATGALAVVAATGWGRVRAL